MSDFNPMDAFRLAIPDASSVLAGGISTGIVTAAAVKPIEAKEALAVSRTNRAKALIEMGYDKDHAKVLALLDPDEESNAALDKLSAKVGSVVTPRMMGGGLF